MTSREKLGTTAGQSVQNLISGLEEVLRLAGPAKEQVIGLHSYMRCLQSQDVEDKIQALKTENNTLKIEILGLKSSGCESIDKVFADVERAVILAKEEAYRIQRSKEQQMRVSKDDEQIMQKELEELKKKNEERNEQLRKLTEEKHQQISSFEEERRTLQKEMEDKINIYEDELRKLNEEKDALKDTVARQKEILDKDTQYYKNHYEALKKEHETLQAEISATLSRLQTDEQNTLRDVAVPGDTHDPLMIDELYKNLYENSWADAYKIAEKTFQYTSQRFIVKLLITVLETVNIFCKEIINQQRLYMIENLNRKPDDEREPGEKCVLEQIRRGSTEMVIELLFQAFRKSLQPGLSVEKLANANQPFVRGCLRICWMMNLNEPPIVIQKNIQCDDDFDGNSYIEFTRKGDKVDFVVLPALMIEGGPVLAKGVAQGKPSKYVSAYQTTNTSKLNVKLDATGQNIMPGAEEIQVKYKSGSAPLPFLAEGSHPNKPVSTIAKGSDARRNEYPKTLTPSDKKLN